MISLYANVMWIMCDVQYVYLLLCVNDNVVFTASAVDSGNDSNGKLLRRLICVCID